MKRSVKLPLILGAIAALGVPTAIAKSSVDLTKLPVGKVSTSAQKNRLWSCQTNFTTGNAGAYKQGSWFSADGTTWDATKKVTVDGSVSWPSANITSKVTGSSRVISGNALPTKSTTGNFPVSSADDAYQFDRNPNTIKAQTLTLTLNANPTVNPSPSCAAGEVGISLEGPPIFNAVDAGGRDAQAWEVQDSCDGHPQASGVYHYHGLSDCTAKNQQFGWALDGFAIWGPVDPVTGEEWSNDDLDECHGITSKITLDGKSVTQYHYVANYQYPYTVGCFRGTAIRSVSGGGGGAQGGGQTGGQAGGGQVGSGQTGGQSGAGQTGGNQGGRTGQRTGQVAGGGQGGQRPGPQSRP